MAMYKESLERKAVREESGQLTGAEMLLAALEYEGVDTIFGYPGGAVLPIYDAIMRRGTIRHVLTRHEQGAVHAADGYARSTGRPGVCLATSGPGATNLVTGIANAFMDSVPLVALTGQVSLDLLGKDSFQEADITGITLPITKYSYLVKRVEDLAKIVREAFYLATTGRPGPVVIDLPKDVTTQKANFAYPPRVDLPGYRIPGPGDPGAISRAVTLLRQARRPVIVAGGGVINAGGASELRQLAEKVGAPVAVTLMGKGAFPENHPLSLGMLGMHGTAYANYAVVEADLLLAMGMRFDDRVTANVATFASGARVVHVDVDPAEIGKNVRVEVPVVGDVRLVMEQLLKELGGYRAKGTRSEWLARVKQLQEEHPLQYSRQCGLKPQYVIEQIYEVTGGEAYITTDVGQHQMWAAQFYRCQRPRQFITSGGLGTMGFGLPAAIGVQSAHPEAVVFDIAGDGSFQMNVQELTTAVNYRLPVKVAILDNCYLGMVRQWQELFFEKRYSQSDLSGSPDFVKLAEAYGAVGLRVDQARDVRPALEEALTIAKPVVLDFRVDREENVFPMVPAGGSLDKMLGGR